MKDEEPGELGTLGEEVSRMLHSRAQRHPDHTDPVGITRRHVRAVRGRRRIVAGATAALVVTGGVAFGAYAASANGNGGGAGKGNVAPGAVSDYSAAGTCAADVKVPVDVPRGATTTQIADALVNAGVVKSAQAYIDAANQNQGSAGITAGTYAVCPQISGASAVQELLKRSNLSNASQLVVTSHEWSKDVVADLIAKRKWKQADFDAAIANNTIGLPAWSTDSVTHKFTVEGMLEPGTYSLTSADSPRSVLAQMVANRMAFLNGIGFEAKAAALTCGTTACNPEQVLTVASIGEGEVTDPSDGSRVAEGVYRRLAAGDFLEVDSTALYAIGHLPAGQRPTVQQVQDPGNPYSTYAHHGLPPTPVYITSDDMIRAALTPTNKDYYYWCGTATGTDFFTEGQKAARDKDCSTSVLR